MENKNITVNMENLSQDERELLLKLIEKANKKESKVWKPKNRDVYWFIKNNGIGSYNYFNDNTDNFLYSIGNYFKTKEEAEFALERQKVITELKRFALKNNECELDWNDCTQCKYEVYYDTNDKMVNVSPLYTFKQNTVYFSSEEIAKKAIATIGEYRLKKYYFEIGE